MVGSDAGVEIFSASLCLLPAFCKVKEFEASMTSNDEKFLLKRI